LRGRLRRPTLPRIWEQPTATRSLSNANNPIVSFAVGSGQLSPLASLAHSHSSVRKLSYCRTSYRPWLLDEGNAPD
jgi:hypothetical protein